MPILSGDIKLLASRVMLDVPEGGGPPTDVEIIDNVSNAIFPDISEADRAGGRVSLRKVFVAAQSTDTDTFLGSNFIIAQPPADPRVSVTAFSTGETFDVRTSAQTRLESYLSIGANYDGFLFGNHVTGQSILSIYKGTDELPGIDDVLVLTKFEGAGNQVQQYVRINEAAAVLRTFTDSQGQYQRYVMTLKLSDPLRYDFPGFDAQRIDYTKAQLAANTKISTTIVADAARYYGVVKLTEAADAGDFTVQVASIYSQLVPSAQVETAIADARSNQVTSAFVETGGVVTGAYETYMYGPGSKLYFGGGMLPGSFTINVRASGIVLTTDAQGIMYNGVAQVGLVDFENGIVTFLVSPTFGGWNYHDFSYKPAATPRLIFMSQGFDVTLAGRALNYVRTIEPPPVKGTLSVAYRVSGKWYELSDDGSGALRGADTSYGAGTVNATTGTVAVTLGALPDVGSALVYQWVPPDTAVPNTTLALSLENDGKLFMPVNSDGVVGYSAGSKSFTPNHLTFAWNDGHGAKTASDNGAGQIIGDATGSVEYGKGLAKFSPNELPLPGTTIHIASTTAAKTTTAPVPVSVGAQQRITLPPPVEPGTVELDWPVSLTFIYDGTAGDQAIRSETQVIADVKGDGGLYIKLGNSTRLVGAIDYSTGVCLVDNNIAITKDEGRVLLAYDTLMERNTAGTPLFERAA